MRCRSCFALALAATLVAPLAAVAQYTRQRVGVIPFENVGSYGLEGEEYDALRVGLQQTLITELALNSGLRVIDRKRIDELLAGQDLGGSGHIEPQTAARIGKAAGARYIILAGFVDWYSDFRLDARIVDVQTSQIIKAQRRRGDREDLYAMVVDMANDITRGVNLPPLSRRIFDERKQRNVPLEAVRLYAKGLFYADRGDAARAVALLSQASEIFPGYREAQEALKLIGRD